MRDVNGQPEHDRGRLRFSRAVAAWQGLEPLEPRMLLSATTLSTDISYVPFWDAETTSGGNGLMNRYGGASDAGLNVTLTRTTSDPQVRTGNAAILLNASIGNNGFGFVTTKLGGTQPSTAYHDTRDITQFQEIRYHVRNDSGEAFTMRFEIKDYRDDNGQRASWSTVIPANGQWTEVVVPLNLATPGWVINGSPDLTRARQIALVMEANQGTGVGGQVLIDDMVFVEPGGALDPATAPVRDLIERLAERQFRSLWGAIDPDTGALETNAQAGRVMAMNTTSSVIKLLPGAIERGWVTQLEADLMLLKMVQTMNTGMNNQAAMGGGYLPARYLDRVTFTPSNPEESVIDGAFMFLALYEYKSQPGTNPAVVTAIQNLLNRFNFAAFNLPGGGWSFAYNHDSDSFIPAGYDGYGGEIWTISLAAHLAQVNHVDITTNYHSGDVRAASFLVDPANTQFNHAFTQFRPPFVQWLFDLYVDTNDLSKDNYPGAFQNTNPFDNAVKYQKDVHDYFESIGRGLFLQPDAGSSGSQYEQFSAYNNHGEPNVFMPWSVAFSFLGEPQFAEASLRNSLIHNLQGPFGLSDSAIWATGAAQPTSHPANNDLWNTSLSTMAFMDYLYDDSHYLSDLPEVKAALDLVFPTTIIAGDLNKDGFVGIADLNIVLGNWNQSVAPGDFFSGDPSNDGFVGIEDLNTVLGNWNAVAPPEISPEAPPVESAVVAASASSVESTGASQTVTASVTETKKRTTGTTRPVAEQHSTQPDDVSRSALAAWQRSSQRGTSVTAFRYQSPGLAESDESSSYTPSFGLWEPDGDR
jgi:hypothetical protein